MAPWRGRGSELWIAAAVVVLDQATKAVVRARLPLHESVTVIPGFFDFTHVRNTGAAFGMFAGTDHPLRSFLLVGVSLAVLAFIMFALLKPGKSGLPPSRTTIAGMSLILGGALGNVYDRVVAREFQSYDDVYRDIPEADRPAKP